MSFFFFSTTHLSYEIYLWASRTPKHSTTPTFASLNKNISHILWHNILFYVDVLYIHLASRNYDNLHSLPTSCFPVIICHRVSFSHETGSTVPKSFICILPLNLKLSVGLNAQSSLPCSMFTYFDDVTPARASSSDTVYPTFAFVSQSQRHHSRHRWFFCIPTLCPCRCHENKDVLPSKIL